jgi:hypothetical protein
MKFITVKYDPMITAEDIITIERKAAAVIQFKERTIEKAVTLGYRARNAVLRLADIVDEAAQSFDDKVTNLRISLRNRKAKIRKKYFANMQKFAEDQAKYRHERLALIALEKVQLETEALQLEQAAQDYSYKM